MFSRDAAQDEQGYECYISPSLYAVLVDPSECAYASCRCASVLMLARACICLQLCVSDSPRGLSANLNKSPQNSRTAFAVSLGSVALEAPIASAASFAAGAWEGRGAVRSAAPGPTRFACTSRQAQ